MAATVPHINKKNVFQVYNFCVLFLLTTCTLKFSSHWNDFQNNTDCCIIKTFEVH